MDFFHLSKLFWLLAMPGNLAVVILVAALVLARTRWHGLGQTLVAVVTVALVVVCIRQLNAAKVHFEPLSDPRIIGAHLSKRRLASGIVMKDSGSSETEICFDPLTENSAKDVRPAIIRCEPNA